MKKKYLVLFIILVNFSCSIVSPSNQAESSNRALIEYFKLLKFNSSEIPTLLALQKFNEIEVIYEDIYAKYQKDVLYEGLLVHAYGFFDASNGIQVSDLDSWISKTSSYIAYTARGIYRSNQGFSVRGGKIIDKTPRWKIDEMQELHTAAAKDLETAASKNAKLMPAYFWLVKIAKASNLSFTPQEILAKATQNDIRTYWVRQAYMHSLLPRWGGSYNEMAKFAKQATQYANVNPLLWTLQGEVYADQGWYSWREGNYAKAIDAYTAALQFGDHTVWLKKRAECYSLQGEKDKAIEDCKRILHYYPADQEAMDLLKGLQA